MTAPWLPSASHDAILRAALLEGEGATAAWREWKHAGGLTTPDPPAHRLLPLLYRKLDAAGDDDALTLRGAYVHTWAQGEVLRARALPLLLALRDRKIDVVILKGAALVDLAFGGDLGLRAMGDVDVLVPPGQVDDALAVVSELGWSDVWRDPRRLPHLRRVVHSCGFANAEGGQIDLHWHVLFGCCWPGADDAFHASAVPFELSGCQARTLCATDHLLQACAHGMLTELYDDDALLQWAVDAMALVRAPHLRVDWDRLVALAGDLGLRDSVAAALAYLQGSLEAPVPSGVVECLGASRPSVAERIERITRRVREPRPRRLLNFVAQYLRLRGNPYFRPLWIGPARYMQDFWGVDRIRDVPALLARKLARNAAQLGRIAWSRFSTQPGTSRASGPSSSQ